jgi:hypothetical protein
MLVPVSTIVIDCGQAGWGFRLLSHLEAKRNVELNVDFESFASLFEYVAQKYSATLERLTGRVLFKVQTQRAK